MNKVCSFFYFLFFISLLCSLEDLFSQNVGIGPATPNTSARVDINSSSKGVLIPRMTTSAISSISNPAKGLMVYDSIKNQWMVNVGKPAIPNWQTIIFKSGWSLGGNSGINPSTQFIGTTDNNPLRFRVNNKYAGEIDSANAKTFFGYYAGSNNTGYGNTAAGCKSFYRNTIGYGNTAVGDSTLFSDTTGLYNTAVGAYAFSSNNFGQMNTVTGAGALQYSNSSIPDNKNTVFGSEALNEDILGRYNTASGFEALLSNKTGISNTACGYQALLGTGSSSLSTAIGARALWSNSSSNTANGCYALNSNRTGSGNIALGYSSLYENYSGSNNTAIGSMSLYSNQFAGYNTAIGYSALNSNYYANGITATGAEALSSNSTGTGNTATGRQALYSNVIGGNNTAMGANALFNGTGVDNTAIGYTAMYATTNTDLNTAVGEKSLYLNTGYRNTAVGGYALVTTNALNNTVVGYNSGAVYNLGNGNTILGANCNVAGQNYINCIAIGQDVTCTAGNQARLGNAATWSVGGYANWTNISDGRYKKDVKEEVKGLDFIMELRPVTYHLDISRLVNTLNESRRKEPDPVSKIADTEKEKMLFSGFVAQEVERVAGKVNYDFSGIDKPKNEHDLYGLRYDDFVIPLVKALQEQQSLLEQLKKHTTELKVLDADQDKLYEELLKKIEKLESTTKN